MKMEHFYLKKVRVVPIEGGRTPLDGPGIDYSMSYQKPIKVKHDIPLEKALMRASKAASSASGLSYTYSEGDRTYFEVSFKKKSSGQMEKFAFLTGFDADDH